MNKLTEIKKMTESELVDVGQVIYRILPEGASWILLMIPPHEPDSHAPGACPLQTTTNICCQGQIKAILDGASEMFENSEHEPVFSQPVVKLN